MFMYAPLVPTLIISVDAFFGIILGGVIYLLFVCFGIPFCSLFVCFFFLILFLFLYVASFLCFFILLLFVGVIFEYNLYFWDFLKLF